MDVPLSMLRVLVNKFWKSSRKQDVRSQSHSQLTLFRTCRIIVHIQPVNTFLLPDISGDANTPSVMIKAAREAAAGMGAAELCARTVAEIGGAWALCWAINAFLTYVSKRANDVRG